MKEAYKESNFQRNNAQQPIYHLAEEDWMFNQHFALKEAYFSLPLQTLCVGKQELPPNSINMIIGDASKSQVAKFVLNAMPEGQNPY